LVAICAAVLWLLGVEVLPNLHLAVHQDDHSHASDGAIVAHAHHEFDADYERARRERDAARRHDVTAHHDDGDSHDERDDDKRNRGPSQLAFDDALDGHAAAGIAHHATALHQPAPPITNPLAVPHAETWRYAEPNDRIASARATRSTARGPPAV
jgi:hypothetical protein